MTMKTNSESPNFATDINADIVESHTRFDVTSNFRSAFRVLRKNDRICHIRRLWAAAKCRRFCSLIGDNWTQNGPDMISLAASSQLQNITEYCLIVCKMGSASKELNNAATFWHTITTMTHLISADIFKIEWHSILPGPTIWWASCLITNCQTEFTEIILYVEIRE